jgi:hypothetical protein
MTAARCREVSAHLRTTFIDGAIAVGSEMPTAVEVLFAVLGGRKRDDHLGDRLNSRDLGVVLGALCLQLF